MKLLKVPVALGAATGGVWHAPNGLPSALEMSRTHAIAYEQQKKVPRGAPVALRALRTV